MQQRDHRWAVDGLGSLLDGEGQSLKSVALTQDDRVEVLLGRTTRG